MVSGSCTAEVIAKLQVLRLLKTESSGLKQAKYRLEKHKYSQGGSDTTETVLA